MKDTRILLSHPTGNANVRATLNGLEKAKILANFYTTIALFEGDFLDKLSDVPIFSELKRRQFEKESEAFTKLFPWFEVGRLISQKFKWDSLFRNEKDFFSIENVYRTFDVHVSKQLKKERYDGVYAYDDGAFNSFTIAKERGINCFFDLPTGHWRANLRLMEKERELWPEWASTLTALRDSESKLDKKDQELLLADKIFVASTFTANTLKVFPKNLSNIKVIPYGFPPVTHNKSYQLGKKVKMLFVGKLSQQKGIAYLFKAMNGLEKFIDLTIVGQKVTAKCDVLDRELLKHNWIPSLPHHKILNLMRESDVLLFPSLFDGFGLVITEAMSQGTPVIATECSGGIDIIEHNENGWIVEAGSVESLRNCIEEILQDTAKIEKLGKQAQLVAKKRPWEVYGRELVNEIIK